MLVQLSPKELLKVLHVPNRPGLKLNPLGFHTLLRLASSYRGMRAIVVAVLHALAARLSEWIYDGGASVHQLPPLD